MRGLITIYDAYTSKRATAYIEVAQNVQLASLLPFISQVIRGTRMDESQWGELSGGSMYMSVDNHIADLHSTIEEAALREGSWLCISPVPEKLVNPRPATDNIPDGNQSTAAIVPVQLRFVSGVNAGRIYDVTPGLLAVSTLLDPEKNSQNATFTLDIPSEIHQEGKAAVTVIPSVTDPDPAGTLKRKRRADKEKAKLERKDRKERKRYNKENKKDKKPLAADSASGLDLDGILEYELTPEYSDEFYQGGAAKEGTAHSHVFVNGNELLEPAEIPLGTKIVLPESIIEITLGRAVSIPVEDSDDGHILYARPPKIIQEVKKQKFTLPTRPEKPDKAPIPFISMLLPLAMAVGMAALLHNWMYLSFGLMSPVMMLSSYFTGNGAASKRYRNQRIRYRDTYKSLKKKAYQAVREEISIDSREYPDPTSVLDSVTRHDAMLWNRRAADFSWLKVRVGTGEVKSRISLEDPAKLDFEKTQSWMLHNHPITVSLKDEGCIGITGDMDVVSPISQWIVIQLAALHSVESLNMVLLSPRRRPENNRNTGRSGEPATTGAAYVPWDFAQWIPHFKNEENPSVLRNIGLDAEHIASYLSWLSSMVEARMEDMKHSSIKVWGGDATVVIIENAHIIRTMPGAIRIFQDGPSVGVYVICIGADERLLPEECRSVVFAHRGTLTVRSSGYNDITGIMPDIVTPEWVESAAIALAPLEDGTPDESVSGVPDKSRLLDVLHLVPDSMQIEANVRKTPRSTDCVIGESVDGDFHIDISQDGPHGLVGGTTGSGKSEFLQSLVASLAVSNTPNAMNFVLIDYKGGAAFKDCVNLPHTVGMVTDLDNHLVSRALISLGAELNYREHLLAVAGAKDIEDYIDIRKKKPKLAEIPRLLIVIDEFASLSRELPDFVTGLVNIAQRGRSLGIHLLLATQRPSGVVSPEIRANMNLRIALRMTSAEESNDVIDAKDAALISKSPPGRAVVRLGSNTLIPFQSSRVGGRYIAPQQGDTKEDTKKATENALLRVVNFDEISDTPARSGHRKHDNGDVSVTDLMKLVEVINKATDSMGIPAQRQPWLPALSARIGLDSLNGISRQPTLKERMAVYEQSGADTRGFGIVPIPLGLGDYPAEQEQKVIYYDLAAQGNMFIVGTGRSGKSTALRTLVFSACTRMDVRWLHVYGIDGGGGTILPLQAFPNVGAVATRSEPQKIERLLNKLEREVRQRSSKLSEGGYSSIDEYNRGSSDPSVSVFEETAGVQPLPHIIVLLDAWDGFVSAFEGSSQSGYIDRIKVLMREGPSAGIHFVVTGDKQLLGGQVALLAEDKIVLRLVDPSDYTSIGVNSRNVPENMPNGRGITSGDNIEVQISVIDPECSGSSEVELIRKIGRTLLDKRDIHISRSVFPFDVEELPRKLTAHDFRERIQNSYALSVKGRDIPNPADAIPFAIGGEDNSVIAWDPVSMPVLPVYGLAGSGKTTMLETLVQEASLCGYSMVLASPKKKGLRDFENVEGVIRVFTQSDEMTQESLESYLNQSNTHPLLFIFDDCHQINQMAARQWLQDMIIADEYPNCAFAVAGDAKSFPATFGGGWGAVVKDQVRRGVLLSPSEALYGELIDVQISMRQAAELRPEGRSIVHLGKVSVQAQIALPDPHFVSGNGEGASA